MNKPATDNQTAITGAAHLSALKSESIEIIRDVTAEARSPVTLFSAGKDSTVVAHPAVRACYPSRPPSPLLHVDSTWKFRSLIDFHNDFTQTWFSADRPRQ